MLWPFNKYPGTDYETYNWEWLISIGKKMEKALYDLFSDTGALHQMVDKVLGEHPEWTTTVQDKSIGKVKLSDSLANDLFGEVKLHYLGSTNSANHIGSCSVIEGENFVGIVDLGDNPAMDILTNFLMIHDLQKIDFVVLSHYHEDHIGGAGAAGLQVLLNDSRFDFTECTWYLPHHDIDWTQFTGTTYESVETTVQNILATHAQTIVYPSENYMYNYGDDTILKFNNLSSAKFATYYSVLGSGDDISAGTSTDYNNFSMITTLDHYGHKAVFTGDLEYESEEQNYMDVDIPDVYQVEHHGLNLRTYHEWLQKMKPRVMVLPSLHWPGYYGPERERSAIVVQALIGATPIYNTNYAGVVHVTITPDDVSYKADNGESFSSPIIANSLDVPEILARNADLDNVTEPGKYYSPNSAYSSNLSNTPIAGATLGGFIMTVEHGSMNNANAINQKVRTIYGAGRREWTRNLLDDASGWDVWTEYRYSPAYAENITPSSQSTINVESRSVYRQGFTVTLKLEGSVTTTSNTGWVTIGTINDAPPTNFFLQGCCSNGVPFKLRVNTNKEVAISISAGDVSHTGACTFDTSFTFVTNTLR